MLTNHSDTMNRFFFYANGLQNTKIKNKLNKHKTEPYLTLGDQIGETEKVEQKCKNK